MKTPSQTTTPAASEETKPVQRTQKYAAKHFWEQVKADFAAFFENFAAEPGEGEQEFYERLEKELWQLVETMLHASFINGKLMPQRKRPRTRR